MYKNEQNLNPMRMLIVDDNRGVSDLLAKLAEEVGYEVRSIGSASTLLENYNLYDPDIILLDVFMPEIDGFEVMRFLKERQCRVKIVIISGDSEFCKMAREMGEVLHLNICGAIQKPFHNSSVKSLLENLKTYNNLERRKIS